MSMRNVTCHGLKSLTDDKGAIEMINIARRDGSVHLFVLHLVLKKTEISNNINGSGQHNVVVLLVIN